MAYILIICPTISDYRELKRLDVSHTYLFYPYATKLENLLAPQAYGHSIPDHIDIAQEVARICAQYPIIDGILSTDDFPGSLMAALVAQERALPGASPRSVLRCQNKYVSRQILQEIVPGAIPVSTLLHAEHITKTPLPFPFFIKPQRGCFSVGAARVNTRKELAERARAAVIPQAFCDPYNAIARTYGVPQIDTQYILAEELLTGHQGTIEGYAYNGKIYILGIVDSVFIPGTLSFARFVYPSSLATDVQQRMADIARACIQGIDYNHGGFTIEFMYNVGKDLLSVIEINPRFAYQFADLYEKVDGTNSYEIALDLAQGKKPAHASGTTHTGDYMVAASHVLRRMTPARAVRVPQPTEIEQIYARYPDIRIEIALQPGEHLADKLQDGTTFFYGFINAGAQDAKGLEEIFNQIVEELRFEWEE